VPRRLRTVRALLALLLALGTCVGVGVTTAAPAAAAVQNPPATALRFALGQLGKPYLYAATGPAAYDCSGFTQAAYRAAGVALPRTSRQQYLLLPKVPLAQARPGDLLFWATDPRNAATIHHVAIYAGAGMMVDAPRTGSFVTLRRVYSRGLVGFATRPGGVRVASVLPVERGSRGDDVLAVQRRLRANGYAIPATGWYGPQTDAAVRHLQRRIGQRPAAQVGPATWGYLVWHGVSTRPS
jgi:hypothetical protein